MLQKAASSWTSMELFSQIRFNFHQTFLGWYSANCFKASLRPRSKNLVCDLLLMATGSTLPAAFGLAPDTHHCERPPAEDLHRGLVPSAYSHSHSPIDNGQRKGQVE